MMWFLIIIALTFLLAEQAFSGLDSSISIVRFFGNAGLLMFCVALIIGPLTLFFPKWAELIEPRRAVGLSAFLFILVHMFLANYIYFGFDPELMQAEISLTIGFIAFLLLIPVTLTSFDVAIRKLGNSKWKLVQRISYIAFIIALIHVIMMKLSAPLTGNVGEIFIVLLVITTIILQIAGFVIKLKKSKESIKN